MRRKAKPLAPSWIAFLQAEGRDKSPEWTHRGAVADLVKKAFENEARKEEWEWAMRLELPAEPSLREVLDLVERQALEAFHRERRDEPLAELIDPDNSLNKEPLDGMSLRSNLKDSTWKLMADRLTGRHKFKKGGKKKTEDERRSERIHDAQDGRQFIQSILRGLYPNVDPGDISKRADELAANWYGVTETDLDTHRGRSHKSGRRFTRRGEELFISRLHHRAASKSTFVGWMRRLGFLAHLARSSTPGQTNNEEVKDEAKDGDRKQSNCLDQ